MMAILVMELAMPKPLRSGDRITLEDIDRALAAVAQIIRLHGLVYLPIFERLEREREMRVDLEDRLTAAIERVDCNSKRET